MTQEPKDILGAILEKRRFSSTYIGLENDTTLLAPLDDVGTWKPRMPVRDGGVSIDSGSQGT
jgi:hypothetical protein